VLAYLQKNIFILFFPLLIVFVISSIAFADSDTPVTKVDNNKHYKHAMTHVKSVKLMEAADTLKQIIRIEPDNADAHYYLGLTYIIKGNKGSALDEHKILKELDKERANELFNMIYP
jgi:Tfp pilus assembly protein PilF